MRIAYWIFALAILSRIALTATPAHAGDVVLADPVCGDLNYSGSISTSDALVLLKKAVGLTSDITCPANPGVLTFGVTAEIPQSSKFGENYLLGTKVSIPFPATMIGFGSVARQAGSLVRFALYTDNAGQPDHLVVGSDIGTVLLGRQVITVPATPIVAGSYWIMAVFSAETLQPGDDAATDTPVKFRVLNFNDPLPTTFGPVSTQGGSRLNYTVRVVP